jgi:hypothetical protein
MANPNPNAAATSASGQPARGTALRGRIEAIGVFDLLRIAVTQGSTGRLLVFNDQFDAELHYAEGRLVAAVSPNRAAAESLNMALQMTEGEFEFTAGTELTAEQQDASLHGALTQAIKNHYQQRVRARQDSTSDASANQRPRGDSPSDPAFIKTSGVHRLSSDSSVTVSPVVSIGPTPAGVASAVPAQATALAAEPSRLLAGEVGRAITDGGGRTSAKIGNISPQEAALVALASKLAQNLATFLGMRELQRFEIAGANKRALLCSMAKDGIHFSAVASDEVDLHGVWQELGS